MSKVYAPVLIVTLNREKHLKRLMGSLLENTYSEMTDVYVGLDYPPSPKYEEGYRAVCEYLDTGDFKGFHSFNVIKRDYNLGPVRNSEDLKSFIGKDHDRWIITEDDNEFSPDFLKFMQEGLDMCKEDPSLYAVAGYSYPVEWADDPGNTVSLDGMFSAYGYGILKKNYDEFKRVMTLDTWKKAMKDRELLKRMQGINRLNFNDFVSGVMNYSPVVLDSDGYHFRSSDMSQGMYLMLTGRRVIMPKLSMVRNWGFDGTGVNCGGDSEANRYSALPIDTGRDFEIRLCETKDSHRKNQEAVDRYFKINDSTLSHTWKMYRAYRILGSRERYHSLGKLIRRFRK
ncbi:MAG: hypothetical protein K6E33_07060 [Lachnospiraceae bacterium]|nr:hypothetical protein [Lachnospiraceae bacterium]